MLWSESSMIRTPFTASCGTPYRISRIRTCAGSQP
jgi:hypothetical protein